MDNQQFLDVAFKNLPGGLILLDLRGRIRAMNEAAEQLLGLMGPVTPGDHCRSALDSHPKIVKVLIDTCTCQQGASRQEVITERPDGQKMVIGYSTVILKNAAAEPFGVALAFQDITRDVPLPLKAERPRIVDRFFTPVALRLMVSSFIVANGLLVYLLGTFWGPMWLLFALTPVATALYMSWKRTLPAAAISSSVQATAASDPPHSIPVVHPQEHKLAA